MICCSIYAKEANPSIRAKYCADNKYCADKKPLHDEGLFHYLNDYPR